MASLSGLFKTLPASTTLFQTEHALATPDDACKPLQVAGADCLNSLSKLAPAFYSDEVPGSFSVIAKAKFVGKSAFEDFAIQDSALAKGDLHDSILRFSWQTVPKRLVWESVVLVRFIFCLGLARWACYLRQQKS